MTRKLIALYEIFMVFPTSHKILLLLLLMLLLPLLLLLMMMITIIITINSCQKNKKDADEKPWNEGSTRQDYVQMLQGKAHQFI